MYWFLEAIQRCKLLGKIVPSRPTEVYTVVTKQIVGVVSRRKRDPSRVYQYEGGFVKGEKNLERHDVFGRRYVCDDKQIRDYAFHHERSERARRYSTLCRRDKNGGHASAQ